MIEYRTGNILTDESEALVNTVNCVGIMGRGIALEFKKAWPENFKLYEKACKLGEVQPGRMFVYDTGRLAPPRYIINFPTKRHWRGNSRMEDIEAGLVDLIEVIRYRGIRSIAIPPLGSGLGGLQWPAVRQRIEQALAEVPEVNAVVYEPREATAPTAVTTGKLPNMTPARATLIALMNRYIAGLLDPFITLLEVHKLMYFMQEAGEPLKLRMVKGPYGPYAETLRHVLNEIEGYYVSGYGSGGDAPNKPLELVPGALEDAQATLAAQPETLERLDRVADLVEGFETPFGLELLATVHWVLTRQGARTDEQLEQATYSWAPRKKQFSSNQLRLARNVLVHRDWVEGMSE